MRLVRVVTSTRSPVLHPCADLLDQVIHLALRRADFHFRVHQAGRADDLLHHLVGVLHLVRAGCGGGIDGGAHHLLELIELERTVIHGGRQAETVFHQGLLAGAVAVVHAAHLRDGHVAFVNDQQVIAAAGNPSASRVRAGGALVQVARVVLDAGAVSRPRAASPGHTGCAARCAGLRAVSRSPCSRRYVLPVPFSISAMASLSRSSPAR